MARLVDVIEQMIKEMVEENDGTATICRSQLAEQANCVPSQITYVLSTRFSGGSGYIVESRRGGGGYIKITRVKLDSPSLIMHTVNYIGDALDYATCRANVMNLLHSGAITPQIAKLLLAATGDNALKNLPSPVRDRIRASILKQMLISVE